LILKAPIDVKSIGAFFLPQRVQGFFAKFAKLYQDKALRTLRKNLADKKKLCVLCG
jgi:hypothetical protein